jgi:geranylgeranyl diphosphate synthase type II|tara:strand:- start:7962 stop:8930 length:969 start_codon:yes stop_codon:yes gene_type:complete
MNKIKEYQEIINSKIKQVRIQGKPDELYNPINYILSLKSKRVRPTLSLLSYSLFNEKVDKIIEPSIALEFFHNFTLIHDDIMDNADIRRGKDTIHKKWNKNIGILSGDLLMIFAYKMLENIDDITFKNTFKRYNNIAIKVCEGQQYDMNFEVENEISEDDYLKMITLKTAVLIGFSLELGGLIANQEKKITDQLYLAGEKIGISFQLMDDYLDVFGNDEFGKKIGGDISSNKKTYLIIKLLEKASPNDKENILKFMDNNNQDERKVKFITDLMIKYQIDKISKQKMDIYFDDGMKILSNISNKSDNLFELKSYFKKIRDRKF